MAIKYRVEISCKPDEFLIFDFGSFAITVKYDSETSHSIDVFNVFFSNDAYGCFMIEWGPFINEDAIEVVHISLSDLYDIKRIFKHHEEKSSYELWRWLKKYFLKHVRQYGKD